MMIYLVGSNKAYEGVKNIVLNEILCLDFSINLKDFDALVITSKNSLNALYHNSIKADKSLEIYAIGEPTANAALNYGFNKIYTSQNSYGDEFAIEIIPLLKDKKVLFLRAKKTASNIFEILKLNGVNVTQIIAYENLYKKADFREAPPKNSVIIFTAPSAVRHFVDSFGWDDSYKAVAIGQTTARELLFAKNLQISQIQSTDECVRVAKTLF